MNIIQALEIVAKHARRSGGIDGFSGELPSKLELTEALEIVEIMTESGREFFTAHQEHLVKDILDYNLSQCYLEVD